MKYIVNICLNSSTFQGTVEIENGKLQFRSRDNPYISDMLVKEYIINWNLNIKFIDELQIQVNDYIIIFDKNSASAYNDFKNQLEKKLKSVSYQETYPTGELKFIGSIVDGKLTGEGIWYYQNGKVKYEGEFNDSVPDGQGKFYSAINPLTLVIPNIANGKFVGVMTLIVGNNESKRKIRLQAVDHPELYLHWLEDDFVDNLANKVIGNFEQEMFERSNVEDQLTSLFQKMSILEKQNNKILEYINTPWYCQIWNAIKSKIW